uniref:Sema domain-containing protein n=1 Tax=Anguilla anguilla TaxID=7936 RepID=A0A0E9TGT6_ANGAN
MKDVHLFPLLFFFTDLSTAGTKYSHTFVIGFDSAKKWFCYVFFSHSL